MKSYLDRECQKPPNLALASITMIEPLKQASLMNKFDTTTASAWISERIVGITGVPADPADILFLIVIIEPAHGRTVTSHLFRHRR